MTFESMSNIEAQNDYELALQEILADPNGRGYNKAIDALMKLYPQWKQHEWDLCLEEDLKEAKERE